MCDLASNRSNTVGANAKSQLKESYLILLVKRRKERHLGNVNVKDSKPDRLVDRWNYSGYHFARDCSNRTKKGDDKKEKLMTRSKVTMETMVLYLPDSKIVLQNIARIMAIMIT